VNKEQMAQAVQTIQQHGRRLYDALDYVGYARQLRAGEMLVGVYDQYIQKVPVFPMDEAVFAERESKYRAGYAGSRVFYGVPAAVLAPTEGEEA
jgi:hypothetical protein